MVKKKYIYILLIFSLGVVFFIPKISTKDSYTLTQNEYLQLIAKSDKGDISSIYRLYEYYHYSINDYNSSINILRKGAILGDKRLQYTLSLYFLRSYYPYNQISYQEFKNEGLYWLEMSAKKGYKPSIEELKRQQVSVDRKLTLKNKGQ